MASLNLSFSEQARYRFIVTPNSVHLGDTFVVSRRRVATCSEREADTTTDGLDTCTVAIINKPDVPQSFWSGPSLGIEPETDVASYDEIYDALTAVRYQCLNDRAQVGWTFAGQSHLPFAAGFGNVLIKKGG